MSGTALLLMFSIAGALAVGVLEELGWTGFAIPRLRRRHGALATALIVGVAWGAWHLLTNDIWIATTYSGGLPAALFVTLNGVALLVGQLPAYRVLMVWVDDRTGSLPIAMLRSDDSVPSTWITRPLPVAGCKLRNRHLNERASPERSLAGAVLWISPSWRS